MKSRISAETTMRSLRYIDSKGPSRWYEMYNASDLDNTDPRIVPCELTNSLRYRGLIRIERPRRSPVKRYVITDKGRELIGSAA